MIDAPFALAFTAGLVATVNPCGSAMLPAYLSYFMGQTDEEEQGGRLGAVHRGLVTGVVVSSGFLLVFGLAGILITLGLRSIIDVLPWAAMVIGGGLALLGAAMLAGFDPAVSLPKFSRAPAGRRTSSVFTFGVSYAVASLSCTLPVFLVVVAGAIPRTNLVSGVLLFVAYGLGMSLVLIVLTLALALGKQGLVRSMRRWSGHVQRVSGAVLLLAGAYIVWFWATNLSDPLAASGPVVAVERWSAALTGLIGERPLWAGLTLALALLAALASLAVHRGRRPVATSRRVAVHSTRPRPSHTTRIDGRLAGTRLSGPLQQQPEPYGDVPVSSQEVTTLDAQNGHGGHTYRLSGDRGWGFTPGRTALLVIDPVNDFLSEGGAGWSMTEGTVTKHDVVGHLRQAIDAARSHGIPVLFAPMAFVAEDYADQELQRKSGIGRIMFELKMFQAGSWGADFHPDLRPAPDDIVLEPHKVNDVFETDLPEHLERLSTTQLIIAGMTANLCCEATGRHAAEHGYDVTYLRDAIGAENLAAYEAAIRINYPLVGNAVMDTDDLVAILEGGPTGPEEGADVYGSDQMKIGSVDEVVLDADSGVGYLQVGRSILSHDLSVPLDAVVKVAPGKVFLNVPKLVVGDMPWREPPEAGSRQQKIGAGRDQVDRLYGTAAPTG